MLVESISDCFSSQGGRCFAPWLPQDGSSRGPLVPPLSMVSSDKARLVDLVSSDHARSAVRECHCDLNCGRPWLGNGFEH